MSALPYDPTFKAPLPIAKKDNGGAAKKVPAAAASASTVTPANSKKPTAAKKQTSEPADDENKSKPGRKRAASVPTTTNAPKKITGKKRGRPEGSTKGKGKSQNAAKKAKTKKQQQEEDEEGDWESEPLKLDDLANSKEKQRKVEEAQAEAKQKCIERRSAFCAHKLVKWSQSGSAEICELNLFDAKQATLLKERAEANKYYVAESEVKPDNAFGLPVFRLSISLTAPSTASTATDETETE
jgi:hypothetical protein